ncbi:MAG: hypothetical protein MUF15_01675, partial [Acidobacteria bacterium]|nr:hypothetical protein [Acidobacteriota bacterium]
FKKFTSGASEVLKLRFDPQHSPINGIPMDLRIPLYKIYLEYTAESVQRVDRQWKPIDLLTDPSLYQPHPLIEN